jgi:hypothetical protein
VRLHEIKKFPHSKRNCHQIEEAASYTSEKGLITRKYRELTKQNFPKINNPITKWAND